MRCVGVQTTVIRALQWLAKRPVTNPVPPDFPTAEKPRSAPRLCGPRPLAGKTNARD